MNLLKKAKDDIDLAEKLIDDERQHDNVGYHLAQAVEKLLKFACTQNRLVYLKSSKGHSLSDLLIQLMKIDDCFDRFLELLDLDIYQSRIRYDYLPEIERADLKAMLVEINKLLKEIEK